MSRNPGSVRPPPRHDPKPPPRHRPPTARGAPLIVLEAMKMEHTLTAPRDGVVAEVLVKVGDQVADGMVLLALESEAGDD